MNKTIIYLVTRNDDLAWTLQKAKDRMMKYADDVFKDGESFFMERTSALAYRDIMNKDLCASPSYEIESGKFKTYRTYISLQEEIDWTNDEKGRHK